MNTAAAAICVLSLVVTSLGSVPDWVMRFGISSRFPSERFFTGFGMAALNDTAPVDRRIEEVKALARADLIRTLRSRITAAQVSATWTHHGGMEGDRKSDHYSHNVTSVSAMDVAGIETFIHADQSGGLLYALAVLDRQFVVAAARFRLDGNLALLSAQTGPPSDSVNFAGLVMIDNAVVQIEEDISLLQISGYETKLTDPQVLSIAKARKILMVGDKRVPCTVDEVAIALALGLRKQHGAFAGETVIIYRPAYGVSSLETQFSLDLERALETQFAPLVRLAPIQYSTRSRLPQSRSAALRNAIDANARYMLTGDYEYERADGVGCRISLIDVKSGQTVSTATSRLSPENIDSALFFADIGHANHNWSADTALLRFDVSTSHGDSDVVVNEDDLLVVHVRCNKPCYLRFTSRRSDGTTVIPAVQYQNYYLGPHLVNRSVSLPDSFRIAAPFGVETLQFMVSSRPFPELDLVAVRQGSSVYLQVSGSDPRHSFSPRALSPQSLERPDFIKRTIRLVSLPKG